jgi:hypothetical protein
MKHEDLEALIRAALGPDGKLACADAFRVAAEAGVPVGSVGKRCNELKIKIKGCQLGCF